MHLSCFSTTPGAILLVYLDPRFAVRRFEELARQILHVLAVRRFEELVREILHVLLRGKRRFEELVRQILHVLLRGKRRFEELLHDVLWGGIGHRDEVLVFHGSYLRSQSWW